jgi:polysaccharide biosynthesis/export protein
MIKVCKQASALCLACLITVGASLWGQQAPERTAVPSPLRTAREKPNRSVESKSGPAPVVEPTDLLIVEVLEALPGRPLSGERLVRPDGTISLGFYGHVHVAGLTLSEIKEKVVLHLQKFLSDDSLGLIRFDNDGEPQLDSSTGKPMMIDARDCDRVFVDITAYNSQVYYVEGDVYYPSRLPYTGHDTVLDVIHYVGGIMPSAERSKIALIRSFPKGSPVKVLPIDYEEITMGTDSTTNYQLLPGDRLVVPRRPDDSSQTRASQRPSQARPSRPNISYFSTTMNAGEPEEAQLKSLRAVEGHLNEVEKKLERLIEVMQLQSATKAPGSKGEKDANEEAGSRSRPTGGPSQDARIPAKPPLPTGSRSPFDPDPEPPAPPKSE